jgi:hypothetical protein
MPPLPPHLQTQNTSEILCDVDVNVCVLCVSASLHVCVSVSRYRMDYTQLLNFHRARGADVTIATTPADEDHATHLGVLMVGAAAVCGIVLPRVHVHCVIVKLAIGCNCCAPV